MLTVSLQDVETAIDTGSLSWSASETEISAAVREGTKESSLFGLSISPNEQRDLLEEALRLEVEAFAASSPPPPAIDWRNHQGRNWVTPIRNQRHCGSCVSFATCASLESRTRISRSDADYHIDLAEADLFFCGCGNCCDSGWNFRPALNRCISNGVALESDFPYNPQDQPCPTGLNPAVWVSSFSAELDTVKRKQAIAENGPVIAGMRVFEDFYYYQSGIYVHSTGLFSGLHAVCVVGYDDGQGCWIAKNSWGTGWGEGGFFRIAYGQCDLDSNFAFYDPTLSAPTS